MVECDDDTNFIAGFPNQSNASIISIDEFTIDDGAQIS